MNIFSVKLVASFLTFFLVASTCQADSECRDADENTANGDIVEQAQCADGGDESTANAPSDLPDKALAHVNELKVKMRYFKAIGFHSHSEQQREEIEAIYSEYGVALPDEYKPPEEYQE